MSEIDELPENTAQPLLLEAHALINGARRQAYGAQGLTHIAHQWRLYLCQKYGMQMGCITAEDVCWMMADVKKVRQMHSRQRDNLVDACGYIGLIENSL